MQQKGLVIFIIALIILALGAFWYHQTYQTGTLAENPPSTTSSSTQQQATTTTATDTTTQASLGTSVQNRDITAYHFGTGSKEIVFIAGLHGGYEWNTSLVAYQLIDYLKANPSAVPAGEKVTVIPVVNPDGLYKVTGKVGEFAASDVNPSQDIQVAGRFNANTVDLNRNFDCDWQANGVWQTKKVSGGQAPFSEPESAAVKNYMDSAHPAAVVVWFSSAGGVYSSNCHSGVLAETNALNKVFAQASGYPSHETFDFYATTGDVANWLAKSNIPAISVLLTNHTDTEWTKNQAGALAVLKHYAQ